MRFLKDYHLNYHNSLWQARMLADEKMLIDRIELLIENREQNGRDIEYFGPFAITVRRQR